MNTKSPRLSADAVERQIWEMWDAVAHVPNGLGDEKLCKDAAKAEADLRKRLARQNRLDDAAPELLELLQWALENVRLHNGINPEEFARKYNRAHDLIARIERGDR